MTSTRIAVCLGTRPEAIKLAPVIQALRDAPGAEVVAVSTGQHREMLDQVREVLGLQIDVELGLMQAGQTPLDFTARALTALGEAFADIRPDAVLVQGDTATTLSGALAAFYRQIPIGHVEAGLRTDDLASPFPEEGTRAMISRIARWHFCATPGNRANLLAEGIDAGDTPVTGNTVIDALLATTKRRLPAERAQRLPVRRAMRRVLVTMHRRETQGAQQVALCEAIARIADREDVEVVLPMHLSPAVRESVLPVLGSHERVHLIEPLDYHEFVHVLQGADLVLTDSGGVQEEAPALGIPVLVMRDTTERPEGVEAGCARLIGTDPAELEQHVTELLDDDAAYDRMAQAANPYGDGRASERIVSRLLADLGVPVGVPVAEFGERRSERRPFREPVLRVAAG